MAGWRERLLPNGLIAILSISLLFRTILAGITPVFTDEAYAIAVGRSFSLSFFDHPPMGFWLPALTELIVANPVNLEYRIPSLVLGTLTLVAFYQIGLHLGGPKAGLWASALAALSPTVVSAGTFVLPDAPLFFFQTVTLLVLIHLVRNPNGSLWLWAIGGASLGFALASKYQAGLIPLAVLVILPWSQKTLSWFRSPRFYIAVLLAFSGLLPTLLWNYSNDWASFSFHTGRAGGGISLSNFSAMALGQLFFMLPATLIWSVRALAAPSTWADAETRLIAAVALGPILMFNGIYLFSEGSLAHWTMPGWICLIPLVGVFLANNQNRARLWLAINAIPVFSGVLVIALHLQFGILSHGSETSELDKTSPIVPLQNLRMAVSKISAPLILTRNWIQAGHIGSALESSDKIRVLAENPHHFAFLPAAQATGSAVLMEITETQNANIRRSELLQFARALDPEAQFLQDVTINRGQAEYFTLLMVELELPKSL